MTIKRRIIEQTYSGMTRYNVQYKVLFWWVINPPFHVGNNNVDFYDGYGYLYLEGAQKCLYKCNSQDFISEKVVEE